jgi:hypothetical protein
MANHVHDEAKLHWKWVILSVVAGLIVVGASYSIVARTFHSPEVQALVMLVGFVIQGAIIGYFSPGITIKEATVGGALVMVLMLLLLLALQAVDLQQTFLSDFLLLLLGVSFSWVGGWVGEKLQGDEGSQAEKGQNKFQWKWVLVGIVVGFALNIFFVFLLSTIFPNWLLKSAFVGFVISFVVTGFLVGLHSPGKTLREPAVAGIIAVILDWTFLGMLVHLVIPITYLIVGVILGFLLSLLGAWLGEKYQESTEQKASA